MTDIVKAVQIALQDDPGIQDLVSEGLIGSDAGWTRGWIFDSDLQVRMENSQKCAIVINYGGGWVAPLDQNTWNFPFVVVDIWADPTREEDHSVKVQDAKEKAFRVYRAVRKVLHRIDPAEGQVYFGDLRVISSEALAEPDPIQKVTDGNGARMLRSRFGISY